MTLAAGAQLGAYTIGAKLGEGGMGVVYRAHDSRLGRDVALKVLAPALAGDPARIERFQREARTVAALNHPHIVTIHSVEHDAASDTHFLTMELVEGTSLDRQLPGDGLPVSKVLELATALADAVSAAHDKNIIHRDLKPGNVMVATDGRVKVLDFGLARASGATPVQNSEDETSLRTSEGVVMGTVPYMSPEQVEGRDVDMRSDIFSLGVVLFEAATGRRPFQGRSQAALLSSILRDDAPPVPEWRPDLPGAFGRLIARCLEKDRDRRIQSARDLRNEIDAIRRDIRPGVSSGGAEASQARPAAPAAPDRSIVVLPFTNLSPDADNAYFSDGLTEELITDLAGVTGLRVISRNSSMQLKSTTRSLPEIGRELGVRYLLTGSVRKAGSALRITAQLVDAASDTPLWAEKYSGTIEDVFDVQERVSRSIVSALKITLTSQEDARLGARRIRDPRAFELYLQARNEMRHYGVSLDRARTLLERAIAIEGETPPLRALRAFMEFSRVRGGTHTDMRPLELAETEARALIEQMPEAAYGAALLGFVSYERGDLPAAARYLGRALELDPTDADVMFFLCITLQGAGQIEPALRLAERFHEADPLSPFSGAMMACGQWFAGNIGHDVDKLVQGLAMDPQNAILNWALGYTYAMMGRVTDAARHADWMRQHAPQLPYTAHLTSLVESAAGRTEEALATIRRVDLTPLDAHQTFHIAEAFAMAGDTAKALSLVDFAVDHGMYPHRFYGEFCPFLQPLRGLAEFDRIVAKAARRAAAFHT